MLHHVCLVLAGVAALHALPAVHAVHVYPLHAAENLTWVQQLT
jgi:hypothetical protein